MMVPKVIFICNLAHVMVTKVIFICNLAHVIVTGCFTVSGRSRFAPIVSVHSGHV